MSIRLDKERSYCDREGRSDGRGMQDRARVAGGQDYEVRYTETKSKRSAGAVKKAVKKVGTSRNNESE